MKMYRVRIKATGTWAVIDDNDVWFTEEAALQSLDGELNGFFIRPTDKARAAYNDQDNYEIVEVSLVPSDELEELEDRSDWLACLEEAGVDNWDGTEHAADIAREKGTDPQ